MKQPSNQNIKERVDPDGKRNEKLHALKRSSWVRDDLRDGCIISEMDLRVIGRDVRAWECIAYRENGDVIIEWTDCEQFRGVQHSNK
ncbi:MAG: hypothetical protein CL912_15120 [Deltaproteobacteria bacterium]|nr:hypothetical protein [Deltaproteobacteria bacterium]